MPDPKQQENEARQREQADEIMRKDHRPLGPSGSSRHYRAMLPGGRMYGEDDSVVGYFAGHIVRIARVTVRFLRFFFKRKSRPDDQPKGSNQYEDYDLDA
ncbi:MAG: hypothetical protein HQ478_01835 [Chloroflexi bacterium]|nr:hypothetical protein [Chloroflexota bacterium]